MNGEGRIITADTETIGLLWDMQKDSRQDMHIIHAKDFITGETFTFFDDYDDRVEKEWLGSEFEKGFKSGDITDGAEFLKTAEVLIMHNIAGFDALAIEKSLGSFDRNHFEKREVGSPHFDTFPYRTIDTAVLSRVLNPERKLPPQAYNMNCKLPGPHTIEAHGIRMNRFKPEHEDWSHLSVDMIHRCSEDVEIGESYFIFLKKEILEHLKRPNKITGMNIWDAYYCELRIAFTIARQEQRGFAFDVEFVASLISELDEKIDSTEKAFRPNMPKRFKMKKISDEQVSKNVESCYEYLKSIDHSDPYGLSTQYELALEKADNRVSYASTYWKLVTAKGQFLKNVTKYIPAARGHIQEFYKKVERKDHFGAVVVEKVFDPPVHGPFTPLVWEDIPLGNRDAVKQILFKHGWKGVNYNDTELAYIEDNDGELPVPWAGKIDDDSIDLWEKSGASIPDWCQGIVAWYVLSSRRTQLLNKKDQDYFDMNGAWPKQASGLNECRGLLAQSYCFDEDSEWYMKRAQDYYAKMFSWPTSGHWRVPAKAFSCATNTFRMRHKVVVNIPSRGLYGKEMRRCFIAGPDKKVLGCDGSGLELRMLAHFMNDPDYQEVILRGDIHTHNQNLAGLPIRDLAKTFIYAFLYGSGLLNLARQLGLTMDAVTRAVAKFKRELPLLTELLERVESAAVNFGYLLAVDGRWGRIRSKGGDLLLHTALNVLLQMTGSLVMKWSQVFVEDACLSNGIIDDISDFPLVAHQHDEGQMEVDEDDVESYQYNIKSENWDEEEKRQHVDEEGRIWSAPVKLKSFDDQLALVRYYHPIGDEYCKSIKKAGEFLGLRCPTDGEYKIGDSWLDTH
jgi:hypothetical protein